MLNNTNKEQVKMLNILNQIFSFNHHIQWEQGLKILTPNQMLSRVPICLAQIKAGKILRNLKMKLENYCIICTDQKNLQKIYIKNWLTIFKTWKQSL